jgi:hypothetical protein
MKKLIIGFLLSILSFSVFGDPQKDSLVQQRQQLNNLGLSDKAIEKLSPEQIVKIFAIHQRHGFHPGGNHPQHIFVPFIVFFSIVIIASLSLFFNYKKSQSIHRIIYKSVETGAPLPLDLLTKAASGRKVSDLKKGIILTSAGLGILLVLYIEKLIWSVGFIPLFIGIGFLIVDKLDKKNRLKEEKVQNG